MLRKDQCRDLFEFSFETMDEDVNHTLGDLSKDRLRSKGADGEGIRGIDFNRIFRFCKVKNFVFLN